MSAEVAATLHDLSPTVPMIGCTTCRGVVLNDTWLTHQKEFALGVWGLADDSGGYAVLHIQVVQYSRVVSCRVVEHSVEWSVVSCSVLHSCHVV